MAAFTSEEIIQATGARLLKPAASVSFSDVCTDTRAIARVRCSSPSKGRLSTAMIS